MQTASEQRAKWKTPNVSVIKQIFQTQEEKEQLIIVQTEDTTNSVLKREGERNCELIKSFTQTTTKCFTLCQSLCYRFH